jgi:hypothetical protein
VIPALLEEIIQSLARQGRLPHPTLANQCDQMSAWLCQERSNLLTLAFPVHKVPACVWLDSHDARCSSGSPCKSRFLLGCALCGHTCLNPPPLRLGVAIQLGHLRAVADHRAVGLVDLDVVGSLHWRVGCHLATSEYCNNLNPSNLTTSGNSR